MSGSGKDIGATVRGWLARGHTGRDTRLDETSDRWAERAGRTEGPKSYVPPDVCRALFRSTAAASHAQRDELYGGSVILVGVAEARGVPAPAGGSSALTFVNIQWEQSRF